jgi:XTP/dITP diphosphohydrolase
MMSTLVLASNNAGKIAELTALLPGRDVRPQGDYFSEEAVETGHSFIENALIKARYAASRTGLPAIADDSGLEVSALKGEPGIFSARYAGRGANDTQNLYKLLEMMHDVPDGERQASYFCAMVVVRHAQDPTPLIGLGRWYGEILRQPEGTGGFGYDPVFYLPKWQCTAAQLSAEVKNQHSHRAQALKALVTQLAAE